MPAEMRRPGRGGAEEGVEVSFVCSTFPFDIDPHEHTLPTALPLALDNESNTLVMDRCPSLMSGFLVCPTQRR